MTEVLLPAGSSSPNEAKGSDPTTTSCLQRQHRGMPRRCERCCIARPWVCRCSSGEASVRPWERVEENTRLVEHQSGGLQEMRWMNPVFPESLWFLTFCVHRCGLGARVPIHQSNRPFCRWPLRRQKHHTGWLVGGFRVNEWVQSSTIYIYPSESRTLKGEGFEGPRPCYAGSKHSIGGSNDA